MEPRNPGGRPKGVPNKASIARQIKVARGGITPLDYLLKIMRDEAETPTVRLDAAKAVAPYVHPKLASVQNTHTGADGGPVKMDMNIHFITPEITNAAD